MNIVTNQKILDTYELECKVVTPLFMGGAQFNPELRTQSFNGVFRWWFRTAGGSLEDEKRLFGWASTSSNQGLVRLFIKDFNNFVYKTFSKEFDEKGYVKSGSGLNYLGFSLDQRFKKDKDAFKRNYIRENQTFTLRISFSPMANEQDKKKFFATLWLAFNLGNFGSRSRRGFGSIKINSIKNYDSKNSDIYGLSFSMNTNIKNWINDNLIKIKEYLGVGNNFLNSCKIFKIEKQNLQKLTDCINEVQKGRFGKYLIKNWAKNAIKDHMDLLDFMGFLLAAFRSYRNPDYENAKRILNNNNISKSNINNLIFERAIFGLPINFYFSSIKRGDTLNGKLAKGTLRRASPLLIKILEFNNTYEGIFIVLKSKFLPDGYYLSFSKEKVRLPNGNIWKAIDDFIDSLKNKDLISEIN